ncbi:GAF domain-containing sensor histidine kinase [Chamaesiphon sp. OTE_75_metabat_556]|uniref:GAF domain-containing sensor histidine kinase n=1 Tax=Chamaesiphon sp. OTE_75_metabat_556 TaxID=2964692 RepID=UPI00286D3CBB|nr:GAF domain-containing sensor histidine kinase [Chamaesiphon sp. OTE_75_metabat_556]
MLNSDQDLHLQSNHHVSRSRSLQQPPIVAELSSDQSSTMPIFAEATALAVQLTEAPVAILTTIAGTGYQIGSIAGLGRLSALPSNPNLQLELAGLEYCHDWIVNSHNSLSIPDFHQQPPLVQSPLLRVHGLRAYLGIPVITAARDRIGVLAILDFKPRHFSDRDLELLSVVSRLLASEFERKLLSQAQLDRSIGDLQYRATPSEYGAGDVDIFPSLETVEVATPPHLAITNDRVRSETQLELLTHLVHELRTPLTSVLGMASVLQQEIYGSLTGKQKDYLGIIHQSGRHLVEIVDEISQLSGSISGAVPLTSQQSRPLTLKLVDLEMLCQLAIQSLEPIAAKKQQQIVLDLTASEIVPTPDRRWLLDKDQVRQIVYYLCLSVSHASAVDRQISIQLIHLPDLLQIQITTNDPGAISSIPEPIKLDKLPSIDRFATPIPPDPAPDLRIRLGLSLSHLLAAAHGGQIEQTTDKLGYRLSLPQLAALGAVDPTQN